MDLLLINSLSFCSSLLNFKSASFIYVSRVGGCAFPFRSYNVPFMKPSQMVIVKD